MFHAPEKSLYRLIITSYRMRLCRYIEQWFMIAEVRDEIHGLKMFNMTSKDRIYTSIASRR